MQCVVCATAIQSLSDPRGPPLWRKGGSPLWHPWESVGLPDHLDNDPQADAQEDTGERGIRKKLQGGRDFLAPTEVLPLGEEVPFSLFLFRSRDVWMKAEGKRPTGVHSTWLPEAHGSAWTLTLLADGGAGVSEAGGPLFQAAARTNRRLKGCGRALKEEILNLSIFV